MFQNHSYVEPLAFVMDGWMDGRTEQGTDGVLDK